MQSQALIYSCSGCSNLAQTANQVALEINHEGSAEMSCVAGLGGHVKKIVNLAQSGRPIVALDGCPLHCVKNCLKQHKLRPDVHITLTELGLKKRYNIAANSDDIKHVKSYVINQIEKI